MQSLQSAVNLSRESLHRQLLQLENRERELIPFVEELENCRRSLRRIRTSLTSLEQNSEPASRLSDDVLALIFEAGEKSFHKEAEQSSVSMPFAVLVSHVSSRWRSIAIGHPFLWTTMTSKLAQWTELYDLYLERSKACSLDIRLSCDERLSSTFDPSAVYPSRCRSLTLTFFTFASASLVLSRLRDVAMPLLATLIIRCTDIDGMSEIARRPRKPMDILYKGAPLLTHLWLDGLSIRSCMPPLECLTSLHLNANADTAEIPFNDFESTLSTVANTLRFLVLQGFVTSFEGFDGVDQTTFGINFPVLESLGIIHPEFAVEDGDYIQNLSRCLEVPVLRSLTLGSLDGEQFSCIMNMLGKSQHGPGTGIQSLSLIDVEVGDYAHLFPEQCPDIKTLSLQGSLTTLGILKFIWENDHRTKDSSASSLWPCLLHLRLVHPSIRANQLVPDVAQCRSDIGHPLILDRFVRE